MTRPSHVVHRWLFALAIFAGASFWLAAPPGLPATALLVWKGSAVALLAAWAAVNARDRDGWLLAAVMACGAIGDVLIEYDRVPGALAFLLGHGVAVVLYLRHRRTAPSPSQQALAIALLVATPLTAFLLTGAAGVVLYATGLGAMAASAWASRFPRYRVGIGAVLFAASDLLIFARLGPLAMSPLPHLLIWPLYLLGQASIALGVITTLAGWKNDDDLHHRL